MRPGDGSRADLFHTDSRTKIASRRMMNCLVPEIDRRKAERSQLFPALLEKATLIQDLRRKRSLCFNEARTQRSPLPQSTKLGCGLVLIDQSQIPSQQSCCQGDSADELFKTYAYGPFALEQTKPYKRRLELNVE